MEIRQNKFGRYECPCCGYFTFFDKPINTFQDCPVCLWEIDGIQNENPSYVGGANQVSLNQAKENFQLFGAVEQRLKQFSRLPTEEELEA
ncbi:CPCC family cysteine-rich protein [Myroides odoratus]|uniref:CPCC family cysteine-rich protein n=1 Tax=Myroides odoratus TaxID=256 RepID=UPI0039B0808E